jgi:hypothetical protein
MTVRELMLHLISMPPDAEVFLGSREADAPDGLPVYALTSIESISHHEKMRSCRSCLPSSNTVKTNVVTVEVD